MPTSDSLRLSTPGLPTRMLGLVEMEFRDRFVIRFLICWREGVSAAVWPIRLRSRISLWYLPVVWYSFLLSLPLPTPSINSRACRRGESTSEAITISTNKLSFGPW